MDYIRGRVFSFDALQKQGYIRYPAGERLKDIFFQSEELLHAGDTVEFVPAVGAGGIEHAVDIKLIFKKVTPETTQAPPDCIHSEGVIAAFDPKTGVIWIDSKSHLIVSHINEVCRNKIGRRVFPIGSPVEFEWGLTTRGPRAFVVSDARADIAAIDLDQYVETGWLCSWDVSKRFGWIARQLDDGSFAPVGDELFCSYEDLLTEGESDFPNGVWLRFRVSSKIRKNRRVWQARKVECLVSEPEPEIAPEGSIEAHFLSAPELPVETPAAAPSTPQVERVYTEVERKLTLKQLIARKLAA